MNGGHAEDGICRSGQLARPIVLQSHEDAGGPGTKFLQPPLGQGEKRFGLIDDDAVSVRKSVKDTFHQSARATTKVDNKPTLIERIGKQLDDRILNFAVAGMNVLGSRVVASGEIGRVPAIGWHGLLESFSHHVLGGVGGKREAQ